MPRKTRSRDLTFFLKQLERTGNVTLAAECAGLAKSGIYKRRKRDAAFTQACEAAIAASQVSLSSRRSGAAQPHEIPDTGSLTTSGALAFSRYAGRPQRRRLPAGRLTGLGISNFFAALANTGNIRLAARAVGIAASSIHARRRTDSQFAEEIEAALATAASNIKCALIQAAERTFGADWSDGVDPEGPRLTIGQMLRFLQVRRRNRP